MNYNNVWNPPFYCIPLIHLSVPLSIHIYMIQEAVFSFIYFLCLLLDICSSPWTMWSFFFLTLKKNPTCLYCKFYSLLAKCTPSVFYSSFHCERIFFPFPFCVIIANVKQHRFYSSYIWLSHQVLFLLLLLITWMSWIS